MLSAIDQDLNGLLHLQVGNGILMRWIENQLRLQQGLSIEITWKRSQSRRTEDCQLLDVTAETISIQEAFEDSLQMGLNNIIVENDSQVAINSIDDQIQSLRQVCDLVQDSNSQKDIQRDIYPTIDIVIHGR